MPFAVPAAVDFDAARLEHRALAINGALNTFDFVKLTGREYWMIYGEPTKRGVFIKWVMAAKRTIARSLDLLGVSAPDTM